MSPETEIMVHMMKIEEMRRQAEHDRMVNEALRARRAERRARHEPSRWLGMFLASLSLVGRVVSSSGQRLVSAGAWLEERACTQTLAYENENCQ